MARSSRQASVSEQQSRSLAQVKEGKAPPLHAHLVLEMALAPPSHHQRATSQPAIPMVLAQQLHNRLQQPRRQALPIPAVVVEDGEVQD